MAEVNHEMPASGVDAPDAKRQKTLTTIPEELVAKLHAKQQQHVLKVGERIARRTASSKIQYDTVLTLCGCSCALVL